jgi:mannose-6-phosphate isomerase-like protein (cupin superfamily)
MRPRNSNEVVMPSLIEQPTRITAAGNKPKLIDEFVGRVNTRDTKLSVAVMQSPDGWEEPGQRPEFDEYTVVIEGAIEVEHDKGTLRVAAGQAVLTKAGEWVRYKTPHAAKYVAICLPAFSPETVHRDAEKP